MIDSWLIWFARNGLRCMLLKIEPGMQDVVRVLKKSNLAIFTSRCALAMDQLLWPTDVDNSYFNLLFDNISSIFWPVTFYDSSTSANIQKKIVAVAAAAVAVAYDVVAAVARLKSSFVNVFICLLLVVLLPWWSWQTGGNIYLEFFSVNSKVLILV